MNRWEFYNIVDLFTNVTTIYINNKKGIDKNECNCYQWRS